MTDTVNVPRDDDSRSFSDSLLPEAMIWAGIEVQEQVDRDNANYIAGETTDWDQGMIAVAIYRAMLTAAPKAEPLSNAQQLEGDDAYLLVKRDLYYRPNANGYTGIKDHAGRYTKAESERHADPMSGVSMVMADEAPEFSAACFDDLARAHLQKKLDEARAELAVLRFQPEAPKVEQEPDTLALNAYRHLTNYADAAAHPHRAGIRKVRDDVYAALQDRPAPASDELLEALEVIKDVCEFVDDCGPTGEGWQSPKLESAWSVVRNHIAKHKGPQS